MITLGIIDDRKDARESFRYKLEDEFEELNEQVEIIDISPFSEKEDFKTWILENEISFLIIDEKLNEEVTSINYNGHNLVIYLRRTFKDLPIFGITNYARTEELNKSFQYYNLILGKDKFDENLKEYLNLFVHSGKEFYSNNKDKLKRLSDISKAIALGTDKEGEKEEAATIQTSLAIPHNTEALTSRKEWLNSFGSQLEKLKMLNSEIEEFIKQNGKQ